MESFLSREWVRGIRVSARLALVVSLFLLSFNAFGQTCSVSNTTPTVHVEGLAERIGDLTLTCSGGTSGNPITLNLYLTLQSVNITNRLDTNNNPLLGISVTVTGAASIAGNMQASGMTFSVTNLIYTVPVTPAAPVTIVISGIRVAAAMVANASPPVITASLFGIVGNGQVAGPPSLLVAVTAPTLQSSSINNGISCLGSPLPATLDFPTFAANTFSSAIRISEASPAGFSARDAGADTGTRILVNFSGYTTGARVFVPDAIVGNDGVQTSAGAFNTTVNAGTYSAAHQLLLLRINGADGTGAGGNFAITPPSVGASFSSVSEIPLTNGAGYAVYEVVDSNPNIQESAQIPVFLVAPSAVCTGTTPVPAMSPQLAPVSSVAIPTASDPIPRFLKATPPSDCTQFNDCSASYFPILSVDTTPINLSAPSLGNRQTAMIAVLDNGGGVLNFTSSLAYTSNGSNWLTVTPASGQSTSANNATLQIVADPSALQPGVYTATITVNAGTFGTASIPVTFTVGAVGVTIRNVGNAASFQYGTVAPGSYAVIFGLNLSGTNVSVTFNGVSANITFNNSTQINLIVPAFGVASRAAADVVVRVDGNVSNTFKVGIAANAPGLFGNGIVNFADNGINSMSDPVARGNFVVLYLTGLTIPLSGPVTVNMGSQTNLMPSFAGAQGTFPALDQVNVVVPSALPASPNPVPLTVCVADSLGTNTCSNPVNLYIK